MTEAKSNNSRIPYSSGIFGAAIVIQLVGWGIFAAFGVFFKSFQTEFGWSRASVSAVASLAMLMHGAFSILAGNLSDRLGPRIVTGACGVLFGLGCLLTSRVGILWQLFFSYGVVFGIGSSALDVVILSTIARWFVEKRAMVTGIVKTAAGVGQLAVPLLAGLLIAGPGWRDAYVVFGVAGLLLIVAAAQFLRLGPGAVGASRGRQAETSNGGLSFGEAVHRRQFWLVMAGYFSIVLTTYTITVHIVPHAVDLGNSLTKAAGVLSIIGATGVVGRLVMGRAGDRIGTSKGMMVCSATMFATLFFLAFAKQQWMLYVFAPVYGFGAGGCYTLISPLVANLFGTRSHGAIFGVIIFGGTIGGAAGPILAGVVFDAISTYEPVFLTLSAVSLVGLLLFASLKPVVTKEATNDAG